MVQGRNSLATTRTHPRISRAPQDPRALHTTQPAPSRAWYPCGQRRENTASALVEISKRDLRARAPMAAQGTDSLWFCLLPLALACLKNQIHQRQPARALQISCAGLGPHDHLQTRVLKFFTLSMYSPRAQSPPHKSYHYSCSFFPFTDRSVHHSDLE